MNKELKPYPFCGSEAKRNDDLQNWGEIFCTNCGCHMAEGGMNKAIKAWNTRNTWIPVDERLPEEGQRVICLMRGERAEDTKVQILRWFEYDNADVSHWMPIPTLDK